jgi:hypothetical protein
MGRLDWSGWLYGLVSGFIGGGAGSIGAGFGGMLTDPDHFNLSGGAHHLFVLMRVSFMFSGIVTAAAYLTKSPLPHTREIWTDDQRAAAAATAAATATKTAGSKA